MDEIKLVAKLLPLGEFPWRSKDARAEPSSEERLTRKEQLDGLYKAIPNEPKVTADKFRDDLSRNFSDELGQKAENTVHVLK